MDRDLARVAVIGGSGFYDLDRVVDRIEVDTPWGPASSPVAIADVDAAPVAFLARHGTDHRLAIASSLGEPAHDGGTVVVINGPQFATRAESRWYRSMGADLINMTQYPETVIARELDLAYGAVAMSKISRRRSSPGRGRRRRSRDR